MVLAKTDGTLTYVLSCLIVCQTRTKCDQNWLFLKSFGDKFYHIRSPKYWSILKNDTF